MNGHRAIYEPMAFKFQGTKSTKYICGHNSVRTMISPACLVCSINLYLSTLYTDSSISMCVWLINQCNFSSIMEFQNVDFFGEFIYKHTLEQFIWLPYHKVIKTSVVHLSKQKTFTLSCVACCVYLPLGVNTCNPTDWFVPKMLHKNIPTRYWPPGKRVFRAVSIP